MKANLSRLTGEIRKECVSVEAVPGVSTQPCPSPTANLTAVAMMWLLHTRHTDDAAVCDFSELLLRTESQGNTSVRS